MGLYYLFPPFLLKPMSMMNSISSRQVTVLMQVSELLLCRMYAFREELVYHILP